MVKFSQYYESIVSARPEWRKAYINYHVLNQLVCSVRDRHKLEGTKANHSAAHFMTVTRNIVSGVAGGVAGGVGGVVHGVETVAKGVGSGVAGAGGAVVNAFKKGSGVGSADRRSDESLRTRLGGDDVNVSPPLKPDDERERSNAAVVLVGENGQQRPHNDQTPLLSAPATTTQYSVTPSAIDGGGLILAEEDDEDTNVTAALLDSAAFGYGLNTNSMKRAPRTSAAHASTFASINGNAQTSSPSPNGGGVSADGSSVNNAALSSGDNAELSPFGSILGAETVAMNKREASVSAAIHKQRKANAVANHGKGKKAEGNASSSSDDDTDTTNHNDEMEEDDESGSTTTNNNVYGSTTANDHHHHHYYGYVAPFDGRPHTTRSTIESPSIRLPTNMAEEFERLFTFEVDKATRFAAEALRKYFKYYDDNVEKWRNKKGNQKRIKSNVRYLFNELLQLIQFAETNLLCVKVLVRKYCKAHPSGFMSQVLRGELPMLIRTTEPLVDGLRNILGRGGEGQDDGQGEREEKEGDEGAEEGEFDETAPVTAFGLGGGSAGGDMTQSAFTMGTNPTSVYFNPKNGSTTERTAPLLTSSRKTGRATTSGKHNKSHHHQQHHHHSHHERGFVLTTYVKAEGSEDAPSLSEQSLEIARITAEEVLVERLKGTVEKVESLRTIVSALWAELFTGGDITRAREHIIAGMKNSSPTQAFRVGVLTAMIFSCILYWLHVVLELHPSKEVMDRFQLIFPVFRFVFAIPFFLVIWAMDLYVFKVMKINYLYMLDLAPSNSVQWLQCLEFGLALMFILGVGTDLYVRSELQYTEGYYTSAEGFPSVSPYVFPVMISVILLSIVFPWRHVMWRSRNSLARVLWHCIRLPFGFVTFVDFFVADWGTSMPQALNDLTYTICYFTALPSGDYGGKNSAVCSNMASRYGPIVALIPYYWRMWQTFLMYRRTRSNLHLINFGKYCASVAYMLVSIAQSNADPDQSLKSLVALVWLTRVISQTYCFVWDVLMDWGWVKGRARSSMFSSNWPYVFATIFDFGARFFFIPVNLYLSEILTKNYVQWLQLAVELTRRGVWSVFRIENENLNNLEMYRKIDFVPHVVMEEAD